uniref:(northern house mosquito) hypothetical protein n=1 Tax=Culex pipiens TaxID=7175 RepID=A0A8D8C8G6_CULPI
MNILACTTTGPMSPIGSKMLAVSERTTFLVIGDSDFHFGALNRKLSVPGSQINPSVLTNDEDESNSKIFRSSLSSGGMVSKISELFEVHFRSVKPTVSRRSTSSSTSAIPLSMVAAPDRRSST